MMATCSNNCQASALWCPYKPKLTSSPSAPFQAIGEAMPYPHGKPLPLCHWVCWTTQQNAYFKEFCVPPLYLYTIQAPEGGRTQQLAAPTHMCMVSFLSQRMRMQSRSVGLSTMYWQLPCACNVDCGFSPIQHRLHYWLVVGLTRQMKNGLHLTGEEVLACGLTLLLQSPALCWRRRTVTMLSILARCPSCSS